MSGTVIAIRGPAGSQKSSLANSAPGKTFVFNLEQGFERAHNFDPDRTELWYPEVPQSELLNSLMFSRGDRLYGRRERWEVLMGKYIEVLQREEIINIVFDTAKELWSVAHQAVLQGKQEVAELGGKKPRETLQPVEYSIPNEHMTNLFGYARTYGKRLFMINHERDVYGQQMVNGVIKELPTGEKELDGWKNTLDLADWVWVTEQQYDEAKRVIQGSFARVRVTKSPIGVEFAGQYLPGNPPTWEQAMSWIEALQKNG